MPANRQSEQMFADVTDINELKLHDPLLECPFSKRMVVIPDERCGKYLSKDTHQKIKFFTDLGDDSNVLYLNVVNTLAFISNYSYTCELKELLPDLILSMDISPVFRTHFLGAMVTVMSNGFHGLIASHTFRSKFNGQKENSFSKAIATVYNAMLFLNFFTSRYSQSHDDKFDTVYMDDLFAVGCANFKDTEISRHAVPATQIVKEKIDYFTKDLAPRLNVTEKEAEEGIKTAKYDIEKYAKAHALKLQEAKEKEEKEKKGKEEKEKVKEISEKSKETVTDLYQNRETIEEIKNSNVIEEMVLVATTEPDPGYDGSHTRTR